MSSLLRTSLRAKTRNLRQSSILHQLAWARKFSTTESPTDRSRKFTYPADVVSNLGPTPLKRIAHRQVLSGIQPTGNVHLGNYLGALVNWKAMQDTDFAHLHTNVINYILSSYDYHFRAAKLLDKSDLEAQSHASEGAILALQRVIDGEGDSPSRFRDSKILFSVVDLHAITVPQNPADLRRNCEDMMTLLLAMGLTPEKSNLFMQSHCQYHAELNWLLTAITPISWLYRMTQFKDKSQKLSNASSSEATSNMEEES